MNATDLLRATCGHDSRSVDGCPHCEAADEVEALHRDLYRHKEALWRACGDDEAVVNSYLESA